MSERNYYVICDDNCKFESMTKEQILAAITQAVESHEITDVDTGFVTKIKELNGNTPLQFWVGTQAQYNALEEPAQNVFYIITDDTTVPDLQNAVAALQTATSELENDVDTLQTNVGSISMVAQTLITIKNETDFTFDIEPSIKRTHNQSLYWLEMEVTTKHELAAREQNLVVAQVDPLSHSVPDGFKILGCYVSHWVEEDVSYDFSAYITAEGEIKITLPRNIPANKKIWIQGLYRSTVSNPLTMGANDNGDL